MYCICWLVIMFAFQDNFHLVGGLTSRRAKAAVVTTPTTFVKLEFCFESIQATHLGQLEYGLKSSRSELDRVLHLCVALFL